MDSKGVTVATTTIHSKTIVRFNYTHGKEKVTPVKVLNVSFPSWHAEMRIVYYLTRNAYFRYLIEKEGKFYMTVLRYTKSGRLAASSKPCEKCQEVFKLFLRKYFSQPVKLIVYYHEAGKMRKLTFSN